MIRSHRIKGGTNTKRAGLIEAFWMQIYFHKSEDLIRFIDVFFFFTSQCEGSGLDNFVLVERLWFFPREHQLSVLTFPECIKYDTNVTHRNTTFKDSVYWNWCCMEASFFRPSLTFFFGGGLVCLWPDCITDLVLISDHKTHSLALETFWSWPWKVHTCVCMHLPSQTCSW